MINCVQRLLIVLALICLPLLTACETTRVIVYPVIITPDLPNEPTHEAWEFISIDENNQIISNIDAQKVGNYIIDLREYGETLKVWLNYYIENISGFNDKLTE